MIPKKIHCAWFGGNEKSERMQKIMSTWKVLTDAGYEIKEWTEKDPELWDYLMNNKYAKGAYEAKKWAFVSDVARQWVLFKYGGIFTDTDVSFYKPLDEFLQEPAFTCFEGPHYPVNAVMGAEPGNPIIKQMLEYYDDKEFEYVPYPNMITNTMIMSDILAKNGVDRDSMQEQHVPHFTIYPQEYFMSEEGYAKHHFTGSW